MRLPSIPAAPPEATLCLSALPEPCGEGAVLGKRVLESCGLHVGRGCDGRDEAARIGVIRFAGHFARAEDERTRGDDARRARAHPRPCVLPCLAIAVLRICREPAVEDLDGLGTRREGQHRLELVEQLFEHPRRPEKVLMLHHLGERAVLDTRFLCHLIHIQHWQLVLGDAAPQRWLHNFLVRAQQCARADGLRPARWYARPYPILYDLRPSILKVVRQIQSITKARQERDRSMWRGGGASRRAAPAATTALALLLLAPSPTEGFCLLGSGRLTGFGIARVRRSLEQTLALRVGRADLLRVCGVYVVAFEGLLELQK
mmetsp:Transcript_39378/g.103892  ORF Transcript_39378/g.103892 Transcript_39378/m.103892 type:complete len:317 (-) Transcript_39378:817-1767(-)